MAQMHGNKLFAGIIYVKDAPRIEIVPTYEIEYPYRQCKHSVVIRGWKCYCCKKSKALVLGFWGRKRDEHSNLMTAIKGRVLHGPREGNPEPVFRATEIKDTETAVSSLTRI